MSQSTTPIPVACIPISLITEGDRYRDKKKYGSLEGLKDSFRSIGSIHPIVLSRNSDGTFLLIAGGRRLRAMREMGVVELWHNSQLDPQKLGFTFKEEVPEHIVREAELSENLDRLNPDWVDTCLGIADAHDVKRKQAYANGEQWGNKQTAALLGGTHSNTSVGYALKVAKLIRAKDEEILGCDSLSEAIGVMMKRASDKGIARLQQLSSQSTASQTAALTGTSTDSFLETLNLTLTPQGGGASALGANLPANNSTGPNIAVRQVQPLSTAQSGPTETKPPEVIPLSRMFTLGDSVFDILPKLPDACLSHVVTDIPYGIDMDNLSKKGLSDVEDQHDVELNIEQFEPFLVQSYRIIREGGFCCFFYDLDHHEKLQKLAEQVGFKVQRWPVIVHKLHPCRNQAAQFNTTKNYEALMFLRHDEKSVLRKPETSSVWSYDFTGERGLYNNKFAKPFELWQRIYNLISFPGQSTLDPFCGEMSACRAALNCGLVPFGVEINETHFTRGLRHMETAYRLVHKDNVQFV